MFKILALSILVSAAPSQKAHVHGSGKVDIAFDNLKGKILFHAPAESIIGFEHQAKSKKDQQKKDAALNKLHESLAEMISFDPSLGCEIRMEMYEVIAEAKHSDVEAEYGVTCQKPPKDSSVTFKFQNKFPKLKNVQVNFVIGDLQKSLTVTKDGEILELK